MPVRQARFLPKIWLMTDERLGDALLPSIAALPGRSGIIFRHYSLDDSKRAALLRAVTAVARRHGHMIIVSGAQIAVPRWWTAGRHGRRQGAITAPVHSRREMIAAKRAGARLLFVSPLFATQSHPQARALGRTRFGLMIRGINMPVIALGGMDKRRARTLGSMKIHGWAAISALAVNNQKRKAVPM